MIFLDTHSLSIIDQALRTSELYIPAISFWEVAMLIEKGRLQMQMDVLLWRKSLLVNGLREMPLTGSIAIQSALLSDFHGDPADRMIVATALESVATLCTADRKILAWQQELQRLDARS